MSHIEMKKWAPGHVSFDKKEGKKRFGRSLEWVLDGNSQWKPFRSTGGRGGDYNKDRRKFQGQWC